MEAPAIIYKIITTRRAPRGLVYRQPLGRTDGSICLQLHRDPRREESRRKKVHARAHVERKYARVWRDGERDAGRKVRRWSLGVPGNIICMVSIMSEGERSEFYVGQRNSLG